MTHQNLSFRKCWKLLPATLSLIDKPRLDRRKMYQVTCLPRSLYYLLVYLLIIYTFDILIVQILIILKLVLSAINIK